MCLDNFIHKNKHAIAVMCFSGAKDMWQVVVFSVYFNHEGK